MYYIIRENNILTGEKDTLLKFYGEAFKLPSDYEINKYIIENNELVLNPNWEEEKAQKERERLSLLSMTKREMFLGLYQAKGITPDILKSQIADPQALIEFEYANDYYRGNPLIDVIGGQLGFTTEQLDKFFETKDYHELLPEEPTVSETEVTNEEIITNDSEVAQNDI